MQTNDSNTQKEMDKTAEIKTLGLPEINSVIMTPDQISKILKITSGHKKFSKIILRFSSKTLLTDSPIFKLIAYPARKHKDYGSDPGGPTFLLEASQKNYPLTLNNYQEYIFGNNEMRTDDIEKLATKTAGVYYHLLFTADKDGDNQLFYYVQRCEADGTPITSPNPAPLDVSYTKPSPPAPPDPNE